MLKTLPKNKLLSAALIFTLIAVGVHIYLTQHYFGLKFGTAEGPSFCNVNEVLDCDAVTASKYSALFGIPIALWGVATNLVLFYFLLVTRFNLVQDRARTSRYALLISALTVIASLVMGVISISAVGNICIFCVSAYVLSILGFGATIAGAEDLTGKNFSSDIKSLFAGDKWALGFLAGIPAIAFVANLMILENSGFAEVEKITTEKVAYWNVSPEQKFDLSTGLIMQSSKQEPIMTIVEFADFRCPHCKHAVPGLHAFTKAHPDVRLIFKPFPLDGTCNEAMKSGGDGISCGLAFSVICAEKIAKKGWQAHDYIFENQSEITMVTNLDKNLTDIAKFIDVKLEDLTACVKDPETQKAVRTMAKEGETAMIQGTPAIFVNNKSLDGRLLVPTLEAAYRSLKK